MLKTESKPSVQSNQPKELLTDTASMPSPSSFGPTREQLYLEARAPRAGAPGMRTEITIANDPVREQDRVGRWIDSLRSLPELIVPDTRKAYERLPPPLQKQWDEVLKAWNGGNLNDPAVRQPVQKEILRFLAATSANFDGKEVGVGITTGNPPCLVLNTQWKRDIEWPPTLLRELQTMYHNHPPLAPQYSKTGSPPSTSDVDVLNRYTNIKSGMVIDGNGTVYQYSMADASKWTPSNPSRVTLSEEQGALARAILGKQVHSAEDVRAAVGRLVNAWNEHGAASGVSMRHNFR